MIPTEFVASTRKQMAAFIRSSSSTESEIYLRDVQLYITICRPDLYIYIYTDYRSTYEREKNRTDSRNMLESYTHTHDGNEEFAR